MFLRRRCAERAEEDKAVMATFQAAATRGISGDHLDFAKKTPVGTHRKWTEETVLQKKRMTMVGEERVAIEYKLTQRFSLKVERIQAGRCENLMFYLALIAMAFVSAAITIIITA